MSASIWAILIGSLLFGLAAAQGRGPAVEWHSQQLSVNGAGAPLSKILSEIAGQTGIEVQGGNVLRQTTDAKFVDLPLNQGLRQLLRNVNFAIVEKSSGGKVRCEKLLILGERSRESGQELDWTQSEHQRKSGLHAEERLQQVYKAGERGNLERLKREASINTADATRTAALDLLRQKDPAAAAQIALTAANSSDLGERVIGLEALASVNSPAAIETLGQALLDPDEGIKQTALTVLAGLSSPAARRLVQEAAVGFDPAIRGAAENLLHSDTH